MEVFNFNEHHNTTVGDIFLFIIKQKSEEFFLTLATANTVEIELKINNIEFSFVNILKAFVASYQNDIQEKAKELSEERLKDLIFDFTELNDVISKKVNSLFPDIKD